jgi:truncated hemoglobin YjbI
MRAAVDAMDPPAEVAKALTDYFDMAADSLRNQSV